MGYLCEKNKLQYSVYDVASKEEVLQRNKDTTGPSEFPYFSSLGSLVQNSETRIVEVSREVVNYYFICVPTNSTADGNCDISIVEKIIIDLSKLVTKRTVVIIKSTIKPGTSRKIRDLTSGTLDIVFCPEFLKEVTYRDDVYNTDFTIFGLSDIQNESLLDNLTDLYKNHLYKHKLTSQKARGLFRYLTRNKPEVSFEIIVKKYEEAELFKYTLNTFLSVKVWYFNEIFELCEKLNIDYQSFKTLFPLDPRIGEYGTTVPGYHGHQFAGKCLKKDCNGMKHLQTELKIPHKILDSILKRNEYLGNYYPK